MQTLTFNMNLNEKIDLDFEDMLVFVGANKILKWKLYQLIKRYSEGGNYDIVESEYFGDKGINLQIDDKPVNLKKTKFICIDEFQDILSEFSSSKGTLFSKHVEYLSNDFDISNQMMIIDDAILSLESILDVKTREWSDTFCFHLSSPSFDEMIKKHMAFNFRVGKRELPNYCINIVEYLDELLKLIEFQVERTGIEVWIILFSPESMMDRESYVFLLDGLRKLMKDTHLVKTIVFHNHYCVDYDMTELSKCIICADDVHQLSDFDSIKHSIESHYPLNVQLEDHDLLYIINQLMSYIGVKSSKETSLNMKDMVLLKLVSSLLGCCFEFETSNDELTPCEMAYLTSVEL